MLWAPWQIDWFANSTVLTKCCSFDWSVGVPENIYPINCHVIPWVDTVIFPSEANVRLWGTMIAVPYLIGTFHSQTRCFSADRIPCFHWPTSSKTWLDKSLCNWINYSIHVKKKKVHLWIPKRVSLKVPNSFPVYNFWLEELMANTVPRTVGNCFGIL